VVLVRVATESGKSLMGTPTRKRRPITTVSARRKPPAGVSITTHDGITITVTGSAPISDDLLRYFFKSAMQRLKEMRLELGAWEKAKSPV
jgi:hypothetical protein